MASNERIRRRSSTWSLPGLLGQASTTSPHRMPTTPDALESFYAFESSHFRTYSELAEAPDGRADRKQTAARTTNGEDDQIEVAAPTRARKDSSSTSLSSTLVDDKPPAHPLPSPGQGTKMATSASSSAASLFKQHVLRQRPPKKEEFRPPTDKDRAEVSINAAFYGSTMHRGNPSLIFPVKEEPAPSSEDVPIQKPRRALSMFAYRPRRTSAVSFSIGDKVEHAAGSEKQLGPSPAPAIGRTLSATTPTHTHEFGGVICESPMSSTLELDKSIHWATERPIHVARTRSLNVGHRSCPPVAFPSANSDDALDTASIRTVPSPRSILKRSPETASLRSVTVGETAPSFDEARRKLEVYLEDAENEVEEGKDNGVVRPDPSPAASVRTTMSTASRISQMPKRAQSWVAEAGTGIKKSASAVGGAVLDRTFSSRTRKRITLDENARPGRSQSQWAIADHILREKTKLPESQRDPASDYQLWNAERLNLNWKMSRDQGKKGDDLKEEDGGRPSRPESMISMDGEPLYMTDSDAWLDHCDRVWSFTPQDVDFKNPHVDPRPITQRSVTAPVNPTQERVTFIRRAQSEQPASGHTIVTANVKTPTEGQRFIERDLHDSPKSSLLLTPVASKESDPASGAVAPVQTEWNWSQDSLESTSTSSTLQSQSEDRKKWEQDPRLCASDELGDDLYNALLNINLRKS